jgi:hypothetical protein
MDPKMEIRCVFFEAGTEFLNTVQMNFGLQRVKKTLNAVLN